MALFHPLEETFVVAGTREEWIKRCFAGARQQPAAVCAVGWGAGRRPGRAVWDQAWAVRLPPLG